MLSRLTPTRKQRPPVTGGGAAVAAAGSAPLPAASRPVRTATLDELGQRADALALRLGTKVTASTVLLACVVVILVGAQSLLGAMEAMERDLKVMNEQMAIANAGLVVLNKTMDSVPATAKTLTAVRATVVSTSKQVEVSSASIDAMAKTTDNLNAQLGGIATSTADMRTSLEGAESATDDLAGTVDSLNSNIGPLVATQHSMYLGTKRMRTGLGAMNDSLAYVIRIMNYIAAPPHGQGMIIRADLPKETLPPIPGIKAEVKPVPVFPRNIWPVYRGP